MTPLQKHAFKLWRAAIRLPAFFVVSRLASLGALEYN